MMPITDYCLMLLTGTGAVFFVAGMVGIIRFPDVYCRLHALTKADNVGLGFIIVGLSLRAENIGLFLKLILIWLLVIIASSSVSYLIARAARHMCIEPWRKS